ncbi:hypothetical protein EDF35_1946 [Rathayibacter sp. PhB151]|uniref:DUF7620 family protein n=1 Tax=Rathayibacter sp. PhB151 TaxID=2485189 RepID=UPI001062F2A9|nr:hypothetical protein [Rathayibacter sp. PhB151]TDX78732.1 hypothetical protein EDF35_1946 [Rathayibacter sp. PhB151]
MRWWKRKIAAAQPEANEAADARAASEQALDDTARLGPKVESVTSSLDVTRTKNHLVIRIATAYGMAQPGRPE